MLKKTKKRKTTKAKAAKAKSAPSKVVLINRTGRILPFNLPHEIWCEARGECSCSSGPIKLVTRDPRTGKPTPRIVQRRTPTSFTLLPHEKSAPMDAAVLECPEVAGAYRARQIMTPKG
jgi:hypothetical protein